MREALALAATFAFSVLWLWVGIRSREDQEMEDMSDVTQKQPTPTHTAISEPVTERLIELIRARAEMGRKKHGVSLNTFNGRDALMDALQESIDLNQYLMQVAMERDRILNRVLNERVDVESVMLDAATGKRPMPDPDTLRLWALALGTPKKDWSEQIKTAMRGKR